MRKAFQCRGAIMEIPTGMSDNIYSGHNAATAARVEAFQYRTIGVRMLSQYTDSYHVCLP